jgi:hypothetical protein
MRISIFEKKPKRERAPLPGRNILTGKRRRVSKQLACELNVWLEMLGS